MLLVLKTESKTTHLILAAFDGAMSVQWKCCLCLRLTVAPIWHMRGVGGLFSCCNDCMPGMGAIERPDWSRDTWAFMDVARARS